MHFLSRCLQRRWAVVSAYLILSASVLYRYQVLPSVVPNADAFGYIEHALAFREFGLLSYFGTVRTYGYPLLVYLYSLIAGFEPLTIALVAGAIQLAMYGLTVLWLASRISTKSASFAHATMIGLMLNPIVVAVVGDVLTEGPTLILVVLALIALINSARAQRTTASLLWAVFGTALTNFSLMIRPANLLLILAWNGGFLFSLHRPREGIRRAPLLLGYGGAWLLSAAAAWSPQYLYNLALGSSSILPIFPILATQLKWGILLLKYATIVTSDHAEGLLFPNPWCVPPVPNSEPWLWYFGHPMRGGATILGHLFAAFNFEYPFVYVYDVHPVYALPLSASIWMISSLGLLHAVTAGWNFFHGKARSPETMSVIVMIGTLFALSVGSNALIAVENRYNLFPVAVLAVLGIHFLLRYARQGAFRRAVFVFIVSIGIIAGMVSENMRSSAIKMTTDLKPYPCIAPNVPGAKVEP